MTNQNIAKINAVAQEMDEMADDVPALADLAQRLAEAVAGLETQITALRQQVQHASQNDRMPRYLREIQQLVENELRGSRGYHNPVERAYREYLRAGLKPPDEVMAAMFRPIV